MAFTNVPYTSASPQQNAMPVGSIVAYWGNSTPQGGYWLMCDGAVYDVTAYPDLFTILGANTTPDLRGYFLRGRGGVDPQVGRVVGSVQASQFQSHTHTVRNQAISMRTGAPSASVVSSTQPAAGGILFNTSAVGGATETRPVNIAVNYIIKAR